MAFAFAQNSSQYIMSGASASDIQPPFSMFIRAVMNNADNVMGLMLAHDGGNPTDRHGLLARGNVANDPIDAYTSNNDGAPVGQSRFFGYAVGKVEQIAGTWIATDSRTCWLNGIAATADSSDISINNVRYLVLGTGFAGGAVTTAYLDGRLADAAIWQAALTTDEITSLTKGFSPRRIRPQSLIFYAPLIRAAIDIRGGLTLTPVNSPTVADHPRVYP